jgi:ubiquinone/menaquinone biosynthesis C-methylase UbiE
MDHREVGTYWDENADSWTKLVRMGFDIYRDYVTAPAFLSMLPNINGMIGLDIGCGEGHNTRVLASRGAKLFGIDISEKFINYAYSFENEKGLDLHYSVASAVELPFIDGSFDFATAFMSFMDIPEQEKAVKEAYRVLKTDGFLQFSIVHPFTSTPHLKWIKDSDGNKVAIEVADYFKSMNGEIDEWIFSAAPQDIKKEMKKFRIPRFTRTLSSWLNLIISSGFKIDKVDEPFASYESIKKFPKLASTQIVPYFLIVQCSKSS